jgi:hypothetical protein
LQFLEFFLTFVSFIYFFLHSFIHMCIMFSALSHLGTNVQKFAFSWAPCWDYFTNPSGVLLCTISWHGWCESWTLSYHLLHLSSYIWKYTLPPSMPDYPKNGKPPFSDGMFYCDYWAQVKSMSSSHPKEKKKCWVLPLLLLLTWFSRATNTCLDAHMQPKSWLCLWGSPEIPHFARGMAAPTRHR